MNIAGLATIKRHGTMGSILTTALISVVIAGITFSIWSGSYLIHLIISTGFGYSSLLTSFILNHYFPKLASIVIHLLSGVVSISIGSANAYYWISQYDNFEASTVMASVVVLGVMFTGACYTYFYFAEKSLLAKAELEKVKLKEMETEKALLLSQLGQLQSQIEPHFLFNTLANIKALIGNDADKAKKVLEELTDLLRVSLKKNRTSFTTIGEELDMVKAYLNIQSIRLGERFAYSIACSNELRGLEIPPFLIQPLVENAIKHGVEPMIEKGIVSIKVTDEGKYYLITTTDNGQGLVKSQVNKSASSGHGIGLENIRVRLVKLLGESATLGILERQSGGVEAQIKLPKANLAELRGQSL